MYFHETRCSVRKKKEKKRGGGGGIGWRNMFVKYMAGGLRGGVKKMQLLDVIRKKLIVFRA